MPTRFRSVDEYLAKQSVSSRAVLAQIRQAIRRALPGAEEAISYQIPAFKVHGSPVIFFAGWKEHYSVYPVTDALVTMLGDALAPYEIGKGTVRFPWQGRVPRGLIARIAKFNAALLEKRREEKVARRTTRRHERVAGKPPRGRAVGQTTRGRRLTAADFRVIALSFDGAEQGSHMGAVDFRVGGRIFATLASVHEGYGNLMLTPDVQAEFVGERPDVFVPIAGGWGRMGATHVKLAAADRDLLEGALRVAWTLRVDKNRSTRRAPRRRKPR